MLNPRSLAVCGALLSTAVQHAVAAACPGSWLAGWEACDIEPGDCSGGSIRPGTDPPATCACINLPAHPLGITGRRLKSTKSIGVCPYNLVGNWQCDVNDLQTTNVLANIQTAGGIDALGDAGSAEWAAVLDASINEGLNAEGSTLFVPAFQWLDAAKESAFFLAQRLGDGEPEFPIGSVSLSQSGRWTITAAGEASNNVRVIELVDEDTLTWRYIRAGTLTSDGSPAFSEVPLQVPDVALTKCVRIAG